MPNELTIKQGNLYSNGNPIAVNTNINSVYDNTNPDTPIGLNTILDNIEKFNITPYTHSIINEVNTLTRTESIRGGVKNRVNL